MVAARANDGVSFPTQAEENLESEMGKAATRGNLIPLLDSLTEDIHQTFKMLDEIPPALEKIDWSEVTKLGNEVSKQATVAGMLWTGEAAKLEDLEANLRAYCNMLQGFLLLCHGSMAGAGSTLHTSIHASSKQVMDSSLLLLREAVSSYDSCGAGSKLSIPQLVGSVWEACQALKKTPTTNCIAIGRAITQVAVSMKDVLREMSELKPGPTTSCADEAGRTHNADVADDDGSSTGDLGYDLSPEEMGIAQLVTGVVSDALQLIKELIRFVTNLLKRFNHINDNDFVEGLEKILKICREISVQVDEIGASVYPPQEVSQMKVAVREISVGADKLQAEVFNIGGSVDSVSQACQGLGISLRKLESSLGCIDQDLVPQMQSLAMNN